MSEKEETAQDLKAIEAQLASLAPRDDRLDRERLIFMAGRESALAEQARPAARGLIWAWPGSLSAMTAVAATLAVMLMQGGTGSPIAGVEESPPRQDESNPAVPDAPQKKSPPLRGPDQPSPDPEALPRQSVPPTGLMALIRSSWYPRPAPDSFDPDSFDGELTYPRLRDVLLAGDMESWPIADSTRRSGASDAPIPYREMLQGLLRDQSSDQPRRGRPAAEHPLLPGVSL